MLGSDTPTTDFLSIEPVFSLKCLDALTVAMGNKHIAALLSLDHYLTICELRDKFSSLCQGAGCEKQS